MKTFMAWRLAEALSEPLKRPLASKKTRKLLFPTKSKEDAFCDAVSVSLRISR